MRYYGCHSRADYVQVNEEIRVNGEVQMPKSCTDCPYLSIKTDPNRCLQNTYRRVRCLGRDEVC